MITSMSKRRYSRTAKPTAIGTAVTYRAYWYSGRGNVDHFVVGS